LFGVAGQSQFFADFVALVGCEEFVKAFRAKIRAPIFGEIGTVYGGICEEVSRGSTHTLDIAHNYIPS
jgi:hypothetical protein